MDADKMRAKFRNPNYPITMGLNEQCIAGLVITGGHFTVTSIEMFPTSPTCNVPPFPAPGNPTSFSSSYSSPKGDVTTPSLSLTTVGSWSRAEGVTPRLLASLGAVGKMNGLTMQH